MYGELNLTPAPAGSPEAAAKGSRAASTAAGPPRERAATRTMSFAGGFGGTRKLRNDEEREGVVLSDVLSAGASLLAAR